MLTHVIPTSPYTTGTTALDKQVSKNGETAQLSQGHTQERTTPWLWTQTVQPQRPHALPAFYSANGAMKYGYCSYRGPIWSRWLQSGPLGAFGLCFAVVLDRLYSPLERTCPRGNYSEILYSSRLHIRLHVWNCLHPCGYNKPFSMVTHNDDTITLHSM